jgi:Uncharacterized protein conserved in archaea
MNGGMHAGLEEGITSLVTTVFSRYTVFDILTRIGSGKADAVIRWLNDRGADPKNCLVIGTYMTGAHVANALSGRCEVTVVDRYPHLGTFLNPAVSFRAGFSGLDTTGWDLIIDTSGLGGVSPKDLCRFSPPETFLVEDPCSDGSDAAIRAASHSRALLAAVRAPGKGILYTGGLPAKTSGTMTLSVEVIARSMGDACKENGALYASSSLEFYERILFKDLDAAAFIRRLQRPALIVSTLGEIDCDGIIDHNLSKIASGVIDCPQETNHEGRSVFYADRRKDTLGPVVRGGSCWFYRPRGSRSAGDKKRAGAHGLPARHRE